MRHLSVVIVFATGLVNGVASAAESSFDDELAAIQHQFDVASFQTSDKHARKTAFDALVHHAAAFSDKYPGRVEAVAWNGIVLSTYAGEVGAMGAMKYAKAAREALHTAERMDAESLDGGIYASLGALYSKVPGGFIGFGDDELAAEYFAKALAIGPDNLDSNYFYGEFLIEQGQIDEAVKVLKHALETHSVAGRPLLDAARRTKIRALLASASH